MNLIYRFNDKDNDEDGDDDNLFFSMVNHA